MSYTTLYLVPESGSVEDFAEYRNAFRGGYLVWDNMARQYLGEPASGFMFSGMQPVWDLAGDEGVPEAHRLVMMSTFDKVMVRRENLVRLAEAFERYSADFEDPGHIPAQAADLRRLAEEPRCFAVCWCQTSVSSDVWYVVEGEDHRRYDVSRDSDHWFMFDELRGD